MLKTVCNGCDVFSKCFRWAIEHEEYGFWAGTEPAERRKLRRQHGVKLELLLVDNSSYEREGKVEMGWCNTHHLPTFLRKGRVKHEDLVQCDACWKKTKEDRSAKSKQEA